VDLLFYLGRNFRRLGESPSPMDHSYADTLDILRGNVFFFFQPGEGAGGCFAVVLCLHGLSVNRLLALQNG